MAEIAVDASAIAAVVFGEPEGKDVSIRLTGGLIAPALLPFELANVCRNKMVRHPDLADECLRFYRMLPRLGISFLPVDLDELPEIARQFDLSAYDAAYLMVALDHDAPLVTLDAKLDAAWRNAAGRG